MFNQAIVFGIAFSVGTNVQVLCGHVAHATETGWTKTHWQYAKVTLYATFVVGIVTTAY
jgi:hypothetical protein